MLDQVHVIFVGQVQGVGFRYTTEKFAKKLGLTGTVQNLPDGSVELIAQGDEKLLHQLLEQLESFTSITEKQVHFSKASPSPDFRIIF
jgi:acylphosphatase